MHSQRLIFRHALGALSFVLPYLLLNRPEVIFTSRIGFVAWYPTIGLVMALLLASAIVFTLICFADASAGRVMYAQPVMPFGGAAGSVGSTFCYSTAAYVLRRSLRIATLLARSQNDRCGSRDSRKQQREESENRL